MLAWLHSHLLIYWKSWLMFDESQPAEDGNVDVFMM
jgi:hypothetical protein